TIQFANNLVYWQYVPAQVPSGSHAHLNYISFGNINFFNLTSVTDTTGLVAADNARLGSSLLMIPLVELIPASTSPYAPVYPQATGPPDALTVGPPWGSGTWEYACDLPMAQVVQLQQLQDSSGTSGLVTQSLVSQNYLNVF